MKFSQNLLESTCAGVSFEEGCSNLAWNVIKKTLRQGFFPVNFAKFSRTLSLHNCLIFHYFTRCSVKRLLLKISHNFQENIFGWVSFGIKLQVSILQPYLKRDSSIFCEFCVIFKNSCSYRTSPVTASVYFLLDELYFSR